MIRMRVELGDELKEWTDEIRDDVKGADRAMKAQLDRIAKTIQPALYRELVALTPGPVQLPIQWTSAKQRRAFFATHGFTSIGWRVRQSRKGKRTGGPARTRGNVLTETGFAYGIPYKRKTGRASLMGSWRVRKYVSKRGNLLTATNESEVYRYVVEDPASPQAWQQFHRNTGWPNSGQVDAVFDNFSDQAETMLLDAWIDYWGV